MLSDYQKFRLFDENKQNEFYAEVNWDKNNKVSNNSQLIKFIFPGGKSAVVKKEYLLGMLFAIGTAEEQRKMIPQTITKVRKFKTLLKIKATKDIYKGEEMVFPYEYEVPMSQEQVITNLNYRK